jgi:hypothetical protein
MSLRARPFALTDSKPLGGGYKGGLARETGTFTRSNVFRHLLPTNRVVSFQQCHFSIALLGFSVNP